MVSRVTALLGRPGSEWRVICREGGDLTDLFTGYVALMALIPALAWFAGAAIVGIARPGGGIVRMSVLSGFIGAIFGYVLTFVVVYLIGRLIDALAPTFGGRRNRDNALKLAAYSYTPYWLAGVFMLVPGLRFLSVLGLYGAYLMWVGLPLSMHVPRRRALPFAIAIAACAVALALLVGGLQGALFAVRRGA